LPRGVRKEPEALDRQLSWLPAYALSPFVTVFREMLELRYLWQRRCGSTMHSSSHSPAPNRTRPSMRLRLIESAIGRAFFIRKVKVSWVARGDRRRGVADSIGPIVDLMLFRPIGQICSRSLL
jgi:hypothetical protein